MKKIFIDTDIFLDTILDRKPHSEHSTKLINLCEQNKIAGHTSKVEGSRSRGTDYEKLNLLDF
jgi:hypothetical protein